MSESLNLYQRINKVMESMGAIGKGGRVDYGEKYAFHRIDDIDDKLRVALIEHGVVCTVTEITDRKLEYFVEKDRYGKDRGAWYAECAITIELVNADRPDERTKIVGWGQGLDYSDKATGKAVSYASKSAYLSAFHLRGQPDNEHDNIVKPGKDVNTTAVVTPAVEYDDLDEASQGWVNAINQSDDAEKLAELGIDWRKEAKNVQSATLPYYCDMWKKFLNKASTKQELHSLGLILAKEAKSVGDGVRPFYKAKAATLSE
jgi:hypothetical protein